MSEAEKETKAEGEAEAKPKGKKKLIIIIAVVLVLVGGGAAFALMGGGEKSADGEHAEETEDTERHLATIPLETVIVNLSENASFLKVRMTLEYDVEVMERMAGHGAGGGHGGGSAGGGGDAAGGMPPAMMGKEAQLKDAIITVLSSKKPAEVLTPEGKETLKEELIESINEALGFEEGPIVNIYFNEFLVQ